MRAGPELLLAASLPTGAGGQSGGAAERETRRE